MRIDMNRLALSSVAGLATGAIVGGIGARVVMRIIVLIGGMRPNLTLGGTLGVMIMGAILGVIFGALLGLMWRWLPGRSTIKGAVFGGVFAILVALLFFRQSGGEFDLTTPPVRAALFAWIPLAWGVATGWLVGRLSKRFAAGATRQVGVIGFVLFAFCLTLALISMFSLASESLSLPAFAVRAARQASFTDFRTMHVMASVLFALVYCGLCTLLYWRAAGQRLASAAAMILLLFAAGFMQDGRALTSALDFLGLGATLTELLRFVGLAGLLTLMLLWPDGTFRPAWARWALLIWGGVWLVLWFVLPRFGLRPTDDLPEALILLAVLGGLSAGLVGQWLRYRQADGLSQHVQRPVLIALTIIILAYLLIWALQILNPDLRALGLPTMNTPLAFLPYLLPWLLLPFSFWLSVHRQSTSQSVTQLTAENPTTPPIDVALAAHRKWISL